MPFLDPVQYEIGDKVKVINTLNHDRYLKKYNFDILKEHEVTEQRIIQDTLGDSYQVCKLDNIITFASLELEPADESTHKEYWALRQKLAATNFNVKAGKKVKTIKEVKDEKPVKRVAKVIQVSNVVTSKDKIFKKQKE